MTIPFALGLSNYSGPLAGAQDFQKFHELAISMLEKRGVEATHFAADGKGQSGKLAKLGNAAHRRLLASGFNELTLLGVDAVPKGSDAPAYDLTASVDFFSSRELGTEFVLFSKDARFPLEPQSFRGLLVGLIALYDWDFGYVTHPPFERSPQAYISGYCDGTQPKDEEDRNQIWHDAPPEVRLRKARNIFPLSLLNPAQLGAPVAPDKTLAGLLQGTPGCTLDELVPGRLWLSTVEPHLVQGLRSLLKGTGALIEGG
ncbi:TPA: hypothetical protein RNT04_000609 [Stenotrophomonas maltophilia]|uniref:hypothetical protein n=1 Tax=Stenotrophomonas TaxID=40323 RepID=UPI0013DAE8AC|nr:MULTISPECIES: hypothetical protein [Stenotrophomonas]MBH1607375.1 hypothetical protein [Stenotrophomonas maltophilia]MDQ7288408.1 hypothetical protein [Stenotrophomonas sp. Sm2128]MDT3473026.1 hypothetical protein [Stenotrophomonas maltophilia]HDS1831603.1 hypothetical protein [Stenotrophomonas maltophilia]HDX0789630.1 hypothetical protein [Stenotrophomonas maltophilia]